jgi:hypothetical protein
MTRGVASSGARFARLQPCTVRAMDKTKKAPVPEKPPVKNKDSAPKFVRGTADPTIKK